MNELSLPDDLLAYKIPSQKDNQVLVRFPNWYGASVITGWTAYGDPANPFELAVIRFVEHEENENYYDLCYDTPITDDVLGYLTGSEVILLLYEIAALEGHVTEALLLGGGDEGESR